MRKLYFLFFIFSAVPGFSQNFHQQGLNHLLTSLVNKEQAMGNVAIFQDGKKVYTRSFGYKNILLRDKANPETLYRIGAVSHTFTAVIIMQLIEEGRLSLTTNLAEFYPHLPQATELNIQDLLTSHSTSTNKRIGLTTPQAKQKLTQIFKHNGLVFKQEHQNNYTDIGYTLLSFIAENITGHAYNTILEKRITTPLHLKRSYLGKGIRPNNNEALAYFYQEGLWKQAPKTNTNTFIAMASTAKELAKFYAALFTQELVNDSSLNTMTKMHNAHGLGVSEIRFRNKTGYGHRGSLNGFHAIAVYFPQTKTSVALCLNATRKNPQSILDNLLNIYFGYGDPLPS